MNIKKYTNLLTMLLALVGCIITIILTIEKYAPENTDLGCSKMGGDCHTTVKGKYGSLGPIPVSVLGLGMYLVLGGLCFNRLKAINRWHREVPKPVKSDTDSLEEPEVPTYSQKPVRQVDAMIWGLSLLGIGISIWYQYISLAVIVTFCPWCFLSACTIGLIFLLATYDLWVFGRDISGENKLVVGVLSAIVVLLGIVYFPVLRGYIGRIAFESKDKVSDMPLELQDRLITEGIHAYGDLKSEYYLIEYADFQCGHCKIATAWLKENYKRAPKPIQVVYRHFPLDSHRWASAAATAAEAAGEQGKFWEMAEKIFANQDALSAQDFNPIMFLEWAKELGLLTEKFKTDMNSDKIINKVAADRASVEEEVPRTPTFFLVTPAGIRKLPSKSDVAQLFDNKDDPIWK